MNVQEAIRSTRQSLERIIAISKGIGAEALNWKPAEDKWSVMEVLVHVDEAVDYWLEEISRLLETPGAEWGRGLQDERRLAALAAAGSRSLEEVLASIERTKERVAVMLGPLTDDELDREAPSRNPRFGTKPLSFVIQHLLVDHVASHVRQMERNIEQYNDLQ